MPGVGSTVIKGYENLSFSVGTNWDHFSNALVSSGQSGPFPARDWSESNESWDTAYQLNTVSAHGHIYPKLSISSGTDVDVFRFTTVAAGGPTDSVSIRFAKRPREISIFTCSIVLASSSDTPPPLRTKNASA